LQQCFSTPEGQHSQYLFGETSNLERTTFIICGALKMNGLIAKSFFQLEMDYRKRIAWECFLPRPKDSRCSEDDVDKEQQLLLTIIFYLLLLPIVLLG
jgi:hypothetical protein